MLKWQRIIHLIHLVPHHLLMMRMLLTTMIYHHLVAHGWWTRTVETFICGIRLLAQWLIYPLWLLFKPFQLNLHHNQLHMLLLLQRTHLLI
jgi:hypothetical protein